MVIGAFSPSGARTAGQEVTADASDAHDARMARFREIDSEGWPHHVSWMIEDGSWMQQRIEVKNIVVESGRRPHGILHFQTNGSRASLDARHIMNWVNQAALASI